MFFYQTWMKREGGVSLKEHVSRVLNKLLAPALQLQINRPGTFNKKKLHSSLEDGIKGKYNCYRKLIKILTIRF